MSSNDAPVSAALIASQLAKCGNGSRGARQAKPSAATTVRAAVSPWQRVRHSDRLATCSRPAPAGWRSSAGQTTPIVATTAVADRQIIVTAVTDNHFAEIPVSGISRANAADASNVVPSNADTSSAESSEERGDTPTTAGIVTSRNIDVVRNARAIRSARAAREGAVPNRIPATIVASSIEPALSVSRTAPPLSLMKPHEGAATTMITTTAEMAISDERA